MSIFYELLRTGAVHDSSMVFPTLLSESREPDGGSLKWSGPRRGSVALGLLGVGQAGVVLLGLVQLRLSKI